MERPSSVPLLTAIPLLLGYLLARRHLNCRTLPSLISHTATLALVFTLMGVNFFYRLTDLDHAVMYTLGIQATSIILLVFWRTGQDAPREPLKAPTRQILILLSLLVVVYTNAQQIAMPDDDYWIHAPLQGLISHGNFPPSNPFFPDIEINGHFGRDLSITIFSYLSGLDVFMSQNILSSGLQLLTLWLFFTAFKRSSQRDTSAILATVFLFFGINCGSRGGLIEIMQNNNPLVNAYLALLMNLVLGTWQKGTKTHALLAGLTLGSFAIVYETHFGLGFLVILGVTPILWARKLITRHSALLAFASLLMALPIAATQGGPLTDIVQRKLSPSSEQPQLSKGMLNQAQVVKIKFPKDELFQVLLETGEYQRISFIYKNVSLFRGFYEPATDRGYAYIWSWQVLRLHFLPLYLLPFSFLILWKRGSLAGLFMGAFGTIAYLVPSLVHFGPIYESEYYRWEVAAAMGFAACLGLALAEVIPSYPPKPDGVPWLSHIFAPTADRRVIILVILLTVINSWSCVSAVSARLTESASRGLQAWLIFPSTKNWLEQHPVFNFDHLDYEVASWLRENSQPGQKLLLNFQSENDFSILYESTFTGISGVRSVGHALPLDDEKIGTTPFRRTAATNLFWQRLRPEPLSQLQVDWVLFKSESGSAPPTYPNCELAFQVKEGARVRYLYKVDTASLPRLLTQEDLSSGEAISAIWNNTNWNLRSGRATTLTLNLQAEPESRLNGTLILSTETAADKTPTPESENILISIDENLGESGQILLHVPFVPPNQEGEFILKTDWHGSQDSIKIAIADARFNSRFSELTREIEITDLKILGEPLGSTPKLATRTLLTPEATLALPAGLPRDRDILAHWGFYSPQKGNFNPLLGTHVKTIELKEKLSDLSFITPTEPGEYRLALYLSSTQGHLTRIPTGLLIRIEDEERAVE